MTQLQEAIQEYHSTKSDLASNPLILSQSHKPLNQVISSIGTLLEDAYLS